MDQIAEIDRESELKYSRSRYDLGRYVSTTAPSEPARICILTQDIFGPVRNAGIGTAYMHAAHFWAEVGHQVTIVYTQGRASQNRTIDYWIDFYRERGVRFLCAPETPAVRAPTPALRWSYQGYRALKQLPKFDFVHSSECGASPYYSLMAKQNAGEFGETIFCIKTSSPHLWSRQGNEASILLNTGMVICAAERYCVEKADLIISPSEHMLEWMSNHGYSLPQHVCVQPNVMPISAMKQTATSAKANSKARKVNEFVFFGRLEPRKGLLLFAEALHLLPKEGVKNCRVTFMGKKIDDFNFDELLASLKRDLPFKFRAFHNYNATQAVAFLGEPGRLAVIPSLLDNSPFTVYESLTNDVLFIAADVGGVPELIHPDDRHATLFPPRPRPLARLLGRVLKSGAQPARLSFSPTESLATWDRFHRQPHQDLLVPSAEDLTASPSYREIVFRSDTPYPLNLDELADNVAQATEEYGFLRIDTSKLSAKEASQLVALATRADADVLLPATMNDGPTPTTVVNFEPSVWTKSEFSYTETPIAVIKFTALRKTLEAFAAFKSHQATNLDLILAIATRNEARIRIVPAVFGSYKGAQERRVSRGQRARHTEYLATGLPADIANLLRIYGGLIDERSRFLAAQPLLKNVDRLLKLLRRLETTLGPEGIAKAAASIESYNNIEDLEDEWDQVGFRASVNRLLPLGKRVRTAIPAVLSKLIPRRRFLS